MNPSSNPATSPPRTQPAAAASAAAAPKAPPVFYTSTGAKGTPVTLWLNDVQTPGAPRFRGMIGDTPVVLWIKRPADPKRPNFLGIHAPRKDASGEYPQLGFANVVVNPRGMPRLAIDFKGIEGTVWAQVSKRHGDDILVECGLSLEKRDLKRAAFETQQKAAIASSAQHNAPVNA